MLIIIRQNWIQSTVFSVLSSLIKDIICMCFCAAQTQYAFFIPEIDSSRKSKQLRIKGTYYVSTSKTQTFLWFKITSIYLPGHEVAGAQEGAKQDWRRNANSSCTSHLGLSSLCQLKALLKHHLIEERKSWRTESRGWKVRIRWFRWSCETDANIWDFALLLTLASLLSDSSWGN